MKKNIFKILNISLLGLFLIIFGLALSSELVFSATSTPEFSTGLPSSIKDAEGFAPLVSAIYDYALGIVGLVAFGAMAWGGVLWVVSSASPSKLTEAKSWIWGAIWGLLLLLGAYIILYTINSNLTNLVEPLITPIPASAPAGGGGGGGGGVGATWPANPPQAGEYTDQEARAELTLNGIPINKPDCTYVGQTGCTSLDGIPQSTINNLKELRGYGAFTVTGGTEEWLHSTHGPGLPVVDISYNPQLLSTLNAWQLSGKVSFYQCEKGGVAITCGSGITLDHIHIKFSS